MAESAGAGGPREWSAAQGGGQTEAGGGCQEALGGCGALMGCRMGGWMSREWGWLGGGSRGEAGGMERCPPPPPGQKRSWQVESGGSGTGKADGRCCCIRGHPACEGPVPGWSPIRMSPCPQFEVSSWGSLNPPRWVGGGICTICNFWGSALAKERGLFKVRLGFPPTGWPPYA